MRIHLYSIAWNEERMLPFFFRHYDPLVERYVIFDDGSTDRTREMLAAHPKVEMRDLPRSDPNSYVASARTVHDTAWKESRGAADWVIWTAVDELLTHRDLAGYLARCRRDGVTAVPALGFQMVSRRFPAPGADLAATITTGAPFVRMSKLSIFDPVAIEATAFSPGRHSARPTGRVRYPRRDEVLNRHFKYIGLDYLSGRNAELAAKLGSGDRANRWGSHYHGDDARFEAEFRHFEAMAFDLATARLGPRFWHIEPRWWRPKGGEPAFRLRRALLRRLRLAEPWNPEAMPQATPTP